MPANFPELWLKRVIRNISQSIVAPFLEGVPELDVEVSELGEGSGAEKNIIHLASTQFKPEVLINNTTYPIALQAYDDAGSTFKAYLKSPDRKTMGYAATVGAKDPIRFNEVILKNCWLAGDEAIRENDRLFLGAGQVLGKIIEVADAEIKKAIAAADVDEDRDWLRIANAQLRYYLHLQDPDSLTNEAWALRLKELEWIRKKEAEANKG